MHLHRSVRLILGLAACAAIAISAGLLLNSCGSPSAGSITTGFNLIQPGLTPFTNSREASASPCTVNAHTTGRARWTVLAYVNAASNLQDDSWLNVGQMAAVGSDNNVNIVVQWKQASSNTFFTGIKPSPTDTPSFSGTRRYLVRQHSAGEVSRIESGDSTPLDSDRLADPATNVVTATDPQGTSDMGDWHVLKDFVQWGAANYPADNLAVVVWDHGSAALSVSDNRSLPQNLRFTSQTRKTPSSRSVSFDTNTGSQITTQQIALALASLGTGGTQTADLLIIDCSLEAAVEVAYQVRNVARALVASEESPPHEGLIYDAWLTALKNSGVNSCDLGNSILSTFLNASIYQNSTKQAELTMSLTDLSQMQNVIVTLDAFGSSLYSHRADSASAIATARNNAQFYAYSDYKDLYDFANRIRTASVPSDLQTAALNLQTSMVSTSNGAVLASVRGNDSAGTQAHSTGLSVHIPLAGQLESEYATLAISQTGAAPNWRLFLANQTQ